MSVMVAAHFWLDLTLAGLGLAMALAVIRANRGPTPFDRVLAVNTIGTMAVLAISVFGFFDGRPAFLDIALLYALINFIGTIAILKYFRHGTLGEHMRGAQTDQKKGDL